MGQILCVKKVPFRKSGHILFTTLIDAHLSNHYKVATVHDVPLSLDYTGGRLEVFTFCVTLLQAPSVILFTET